MSGVSGELLDHPHAAVEVGVELEDQRAVRDRLDELGGGDLAAREEHDRWGCRPRRSRRRAPREVSPVEAQATARIGRAPGPHLLHRGDEHGHAQVLEGPGVGDAALLQPDLLEADLPGVAVEPEERRAPLVHRDHVLVGELRVDPLLLAPDARADGQGPPRKRPSKRAFQSAAERARERVEVVLDLEQPLAAGAAVDDLGEGGAEVAALRAAEPARRTVGWAVGGHGGGRLNLPKARGRLASVRRRVSRRP